MFRGGSPHGYPRKFLPLASTVALLQCALIDSELAADAVKGAGWLETWEKKGRERERCNFRYFLEYYFYMILYIYINSFWGLLLTTLDSV
jgi:hypothetical protein